MQEQKSQRRMLLYSAAVTSTALLVVLGMLPMLSRPPLWPLLACVVAAVALERLYLMQPQAAGGSVPSPALAVVSSALWLLGPTAALLCACAAAVLNACFRRERRWERILLSVDGVALAALASGAAARALGLRPGEPLSLESLLVVGLALLIYFAVGTAVVAGAVAIDTNSHVVSTWQQHFLWLAPQYPAMGIVGAVGAAAFLSLGVAGLLGYAIPLITVYYSLRLYLERAETDLQQSRDRNALLEDPNERLIEALASIVDARDALLYGHSAQVAQYAVAIGAELGIRGAELDRVRKAALLHDVGKVAVPEQILFKPGPLTPEEYETMQHHTIVGERLVGLVDALRPLSVLVGQHHEAWNGRGYPRGLKQEEIELGARIINLCDSLDTILSDRPYKAGRPLEWAVAEVRRCRGTQFDPAVVDAFLRVLERQGPALFTNSAHAATVGLRRSELFNELHRLGLNVRGFAPVVGGRMS